MKSRKRQTRSDKFPLTLHPTGQYCKKIKGKIHYFGSDKKRALEGYLDQAAYLHGGQNGTTGRVGVAMSIRDLRELYLRYQHSKVLAGELTPRHYSFYRVLSWNPWLRVFFRGVAALHLPLRC